MPNNECMPKVKEGIDSAVPLIQILVFPALSMIMFYKWVKLLLHRIDKKFYWEEIKTVLSDLIHRKLKGELLLLF